MSNSLESQPTNHCVCVWFGDRKIIGDALPNAEAVWFETAMRRQWRACQVFNERVPTGQLGNQ